jgi:hypothetical protein
MPHKRLSEKIKLAGGPEKTVTWIWLEDGQRKLEYYDFSAPAQTFLGKDIAWTITVHDMEKLFSVLNKDELSLLPWIEQHFKSYFRIERESWA